jgi:hypothetical protein
MSLLTTLTNLKAQLANAGPGGVCYPADFTVNEVRQHLGLYDVLNGLNLLESPFEGLFARIVCLVHLLFLLCSCRSVILFSHTV